MLDAGLGQCWIRQRRPPDRIWAPSSWSYFSTAWARSGKVFDPKKEPQRYPEQAKWSQKGCQNEPRKLQRHPCGAWSKKYWKSVPKDANSGARFWTQIDKNLKILSPKSFRNLSLKKHEKWFQNDAKREPEIINVSIYWKRVTFGNCWFYRRKI